MTGPIKQKRAASGYELLKGDDELETRGPKRDGSVEELKSLIETVLVGRLCQTPRRLAETPYNSSCLPRTASDALNRSSVLLCVRSRRASGN